MGVIGIIYEARPNVTSDAAALCLKAGNAVILRGGKEAMRIQPGRGAGLCGPVWSAAGLPAGYRAAGGGYLPGDSRRP